MFLSIILAAVLAASLPSEKDFVASPNQGFTFCDDRVSGVGLMDVARVENKNGVFIRYKTDEGNVVVATWKDPDADPVEISVGMIKDGKLVITSRHPYSDILDSNGPCPFAYPLKS